MLKILKARLQQYVRREHPNVQAGFSEGRGTRDQIANICQIIKKAREFQKNIYSCFIDYVKAFDCVQFSSVTKSCPTLCDPMNLSTPGLPVHHQILEFTQTHVHQVGDAIQPHNKLWKILKEMGIPDHLTCLLRNLYASQEVTVRTGHETTDWFQIGKGVCQGCILSPCLFSLYAEYIMRNTG